MDRALPDPSLRSGRRGADRDDRVARSRFRLPWNEWGGTSCLAVTIALHCDAFNT